MFKPNWMEVLILLGMFGVIAAIAAYLIQRLFFWNKSHDRSLGHIRKHALWTGIIAWALSSLAGAAQAGIVTPALSDVLGSPWDILPWFAIVAPAVAALVVHAIGQATWPAPKSARRTAVLQYRRIRDYVEPALGWTVLGVFALTAGVLAFLFFVPGFSASPAGIITDAGVPGMIHKGRVPGYVLATALATGLAVLAGGTLLVMRLIASRRSLESLSAEQNTTLRIIGMNRLLRVSATVASGFVAVAGNFLFQPAPGSQTASWTNWLGVANVAVLLVMLYWKPPALKESTAPGVGGHQDTGPGPATSLLLGDGPAAARLTNSTPMAAAIAGILGGLAGLLLTPWFGWLGPLALALVFVLLAHWGMEWLLRRNYATPGTPRTPLKAAVPTTLPVAILVACLGLAPALVAVNSISQGGMYDWRGFAGASAHNVVPLLCAAAILCVGSAAAASVLSRPGLISADPLLDRTLRRRALFRILRTVAGGLFAVLGGILLNLATAPRSNPGSGLGLVGAACMLAAVVLCFYPLKGLTPAAFMPPAGAKAHRTTGSGR